MSDKPPRYPDDLLAELRASLAELGALQLPAQAVEPLQRARQAADKLSIALNTIDGQAAQASMQERARFISTMTHELRLPLTSIKGYTDLLRQGAAGPVSEQQMGFLGVIRNNVDRMTVLITDLSDIARLDSGRLKIDIMPVPVMNHIEKALRDIYPLLHEKGHKIDVQIPGELPPVLADPVRLVQVFTALLRNACMYTPENGLVCVQAGREGNEVRFEVIDNGIGIRAEEQSRLFSPFFRSDDAIVREQQGWGLSLSVIFRLVSTMGGRIGAVSSAGQGSTFWVALPAAPG